MMSQWFSQALAEREISVNHGEPLMGPYADPCAYESAIERGEDDNYGGIQYSAIVGVRVQDEALHVFTHNADLTPKRVILTYNSATEASSAAERVRYGIERVARVQGRPRRLLLLVNPVAGSGRSRHLVATFLRPFFEQLAGIELKIVETREGFREDGLREALRERFDGYVAVGGDGLFAYLVNTLYDVYECFPAPLAHVPAGSTDAVACTLASRAPFASALCTVLSRRSAIDYLEVSAVRRGVQRTTRAVCICTAGFMADTITLSDSIRRVCKLGPFRNDIAGFIALFRNRSHTCDIRYVESIIQNGISPSQDCVGASCERCRVSTAGASSEPSATSWKSLRGEFLSVMILNHACKSDKTPRGMLHRAHTGDGVSFLVCVKKCNPLRYLLFLLSMSLFGLRLYDRRIIDIIPVVEVEVRGPSAFNVDGELVTAEDAAVRVKVRRGLPVFAK